MAKEKGDKMKPRERKWRKASGLAGPGGVYKNVRMEGEVRVRIGE